MRISNFELRIANLLLLYAAALLICLPVAGQASIFDVAAFDRERVLKAANQYLTELADGRGMRTALDFMVPYLRDKRKWPLAPDVMYDQNWPMRQSSLLFGGLALGRSEYVELWKSLPADSKVEEVIRNLFIRQPVLWQ